MNKRLETTVELKKGEQKIPFALVINGDTLQLPFCTQDVFVFKHAKKGEEDLGHAVTALVARDKVVFEYFRFGKHVCSFTPLHDMFENLGELKSLIIGAAPNELKDYAHVAFNEVKDLLDGTSQFFLRYRFDKSNK